MPVPAPNLYPPFNIVRLSHVEYGVRDLAASRAFWVDTLGLQVSYEDDSRIYLRAMEERGHHCVVLAKAEAPDVRVLGFKLWDEAALDTAAEWFAARLWHVRCLATGAARRPSDCDRRWCAVQRREVSAGHIAPPAVSSAACTTRA